MKKKAFALLAALSLSLTACAGGNGANNGSGSSAKGEEMRVGLEGAFPPYSMHNEKGDLTGFEVELSKQLVEGLGKKPVYVETKWDSLIAGLDVDRYDIVINNIVITPERQKRYDFTIPYMNTPAYLVVPKDSDIKTAADLPGHTCTSATSSNYTTMLQKAGVKTFPTDGGFQTGIKAVEQGRADCIANASITVGYYLEQNPEAKAKLRTIPFGSADDDPVAIMLKKGSDEEVKALNAQIKKGLEDGSIEATIAKYAGKDAAAASVAYAKKQAGIK